MEADERAGDTDERARHVAVPRYELPAQPRLPVAVEEKPGSDADRQHDKEVGEARRDHGHQVLTISRATSTRTIAPIAATTTCAMTGSAIGIRMLSAENR